MTARKHDASTRFWDLVKKYKSLATEEEDPKWNNPFEVFLRPALSVSVQPGNILDDAIALAFAKTGFSVRNPTNWKLLLGLFCVAHFAAWPKSAAPKLWTKTRLRQLDQDAAEIWSRHADFSDEAVARNLKTTKLYRTRYGRYSIATIRERLAEARQFKREAERLLNSHLDVVRRLYASVGFEWTSAIEAEITRSFTETERKMSAL
jgi:hypothetical protein